MADVELVIKIPEDMYKLISEDKYGVHQGRIYNMIRNGTPLPKGHGRLIDADALVAKGDVTESYLNIFAPTIIEADKE